MSFLPDLYSKGWGKVGSEGMRGGEKEEGREKGKEVGRAGGGGSFKKYISPSSTLQ